MFADTGYDKHSLRVPELHSQVCNYYPQQQSIPNHRNVEKENEQ